MNLFSTEVSFAGWQIDRSWLEIFLHTAKKTNTVITDDHFVRKVIVRRACFLGVDNE